MAAWIWVFLAMSAGTMQIFLNGIVRGLSVVSLVACILALIRLAPSASLFAAARWLPAMGIGVMGLLSVLWSEAPEQSFRIAAMTLITMMSGVIMADRLTPSRFLSALHCAVMLLVLTSLTRYNSAYPLVGWTGSKNLMGFYALVGFISAMAVLFDPNQRPAMRGFGLLSAPFCLLALVLTKSAGALVAGGVGLGIFLGLATMRWLSPQGRMRALVMVTVIATPMIIARPVLVEAAHNFQEQVLKKDRTLTGRTYLWERAEPIIASRPIIGHGYASFWRQGSLDAEGLWRFAGIQARSGFNFHSEYVDTAVALGYVGVGVLVLTMLMLGVPLVIRAILTPTIPLAFFTAITLAAFVKTSTESGLISAWSPFTILLYVAGVYGMRGDVSRAPQPLAQPAPGRPMILQQPTSSAGPAE